MATHRCRVFRTTVVAGSVAFFDLEERKEEDQSDRIGNLCSKNNDHVIDQIGGLKRRSLDKFVRILFVLDDFKKGQLQPDISISCSDDAISHGETVSALAVSAFLQTQIHVNAST